jgi:hypothetical protein
VNQHLTPIEIAFKVLKKSVICGILALIVDNRSLIEIIFAAQK